MSKTQRSAVLAALVMYFVGAAQAQPGPADGDSKLPPSDAMAWALGTNLGITAVLHQGGATAEKVNDRMQTVATIAEALDTTAPELPERTTQEDARFSAEVLHYMLRGVEPLAKSLKTQHGDRHASLFELAIKSSALAIIYSPGDETGLNVAQVIEDRAKRCQLPNELWKPLVDAIRGKASAQDVNRQMFRMHSSVQKHLMEGD